MCLTIFSHSKVDVNSWKLDRQQAFFPLHLNLSNIRTMQRDPVKVRNPNCTLKDTVTDPHRCSLRLLRKKSHPNVMENRWSRVLAFPCSSHWHLLDSKSHSVPLSSNWQSGQWYTYRGKLEKQDDTREAILLGQRPHSQHSHLARLIFILWWDRVLLCSMYLELTT